MIMYSVSSSHMVVGCREWVSLPDLRIPIVRAKIDSGAKTSSIHAYNIQIITQNSCDIVQFELHPLQKNDVLIVKCEALLVGFKTVRSSNGKAEKRPVIATTMVLGGVASIIYLNLTNRDAMGVRMLIGRQALNGCLIDPSHNYLQGRYNKKRILEIYGG